MATQRLARELPFTDVARAILARVARALGMRVAGLFVFTRLLLFGLGLAWIGFAAQPDALTVMPRRAQPRATRDALEVADVQWYLSIARHGYEHRAFSADRQANLAFYPLWPLAMRAAAAPFGHMVLVGTLLANLLAVAALVIAFPSAYFFSRPGPESLFLLLVVGAFLAARSDRGPLAGVCAGLAALTRIQGALLCVPLGVLLQLEQRRRPRPWRAFAWRVWPIALPLAALGGQMLYLRHITGNIKANFDIQKAWANPLSYPFAGVVRFLEHPRLIDSYGWDLSPLSFVFLVGAVALSVLMLARWPRNWTDLTYVG